MVDIPPTCRSIRSFFFRKFDKLIFMKRILALSILISSIAFVFVSCHCRKQSQSTATEVKKDFVQEGYTKATVIYYELDGCNYLLQLENESKLEPTNLAADFKKDKLDVWVKYTIDTAAVSICMAGQLVKLSDIQLRK